MRDGEVLDEEALGDALRELFAAGGLGKRVRIGVANQRTVLRILELPPVTDRRSWPRRHLPGPGPGPDAAQQRGPRLSPARGHRHPRGPRQRVVLVAAQRDMVERLLGAVRRAGLTAEGVDLSAFALIRSLYRPKKSSPAGSST